MNSQRLKQLRLARGLSLDALAAKLGGIVTKQALSKYEQGKAKPSPRVLTQLASTLGVKAVHLFTEPELESLATIERRTFLRLPLQERSRILAAQADQQMVEYYNQNQEWQAEQGGDFIDA
jgi:transcriptional regulator with XRE-family HTH domain